MIDAGRASARWLRTWCVATLFGSGMWSVPATAEFAWGGGYSLTYDSNLTRTPDPTSEWTSGLYGGFFYRENAGGLNARLLAQVEQRNYARNTFPDDAGVLVDGSAVWTISPQRLVWVLENLYREARQQITAADTPDNRADTNTLSTGPDLTLRSSSTNSLLLGARYGRFDIRGPGDNDRVIGHARLLHQLAGAATVSLNYEAMRANFTAPALYTQVFREDLFARYEARGSATDLMSIDAGVTRVVPEGGEKTDGRLARINVLRQLTSESSARLALSDQISDTFTDMLARSSFTIPTAVGEAYRSQSADLGYGVRGGRLGYTLQGYGRKIDYQQESDDYQETGGRVSATWVTAGDLRVEGGFEYLRRKFLDTERTDRERIQRINLTHFLARSVHLVVEAVRTDNDSTDPLLTYVNRRVLVSVGYSSGPAYGTQSPHRR